MKFLKDLFAINRTYMFIILLSCASYGYAQKDPCAKYKNGTRKIVDKFTGEITYRNINSEIVVKSNNDNTYLEWNIEIITPVKREYSNLLIKHGDNITDMSLDDSNSYYDEIAGTGISHSIKTAYGYTNIKGRDTYYRCNVTLTDPYMLIDIFNSKKIDIRACGQVNVDISVSHTSRQWGLKIVKLFECMQ